MNRQAIIERERRLRPWAAGAAIAALPLFLAGVALQSSGVTSSALATETLRWVNDNEGSLLLGSILVALAFALVALPLTYLFRAAAARSERMMVGLITFCVLGPVAYGAQGVIAALAQIDIGQQFVGQEAGVGDIYSLATNLYEDSGLITAAGYVSSLGLLAMLFAMVYTPLWAVRTGLLTRFHGTLGMALGASFILPPLAQLIVTGTLAWFMYFGLVLLGRAPNGRPPAWDAGEAIPWPQPGQEPATATGPRDEVVEGDAAEIPGVGESAHSARRERAKRRKRKRRR